MLPLRPPLCGENRWRCARRGPPQSAQSSRSPDGCHPGNDWLLIMVQASLQTHLGGLDDPRYEVVL